MTATEARNAGVFEDNTLLMSRLRESIEDPEWTTSKGIPNQYAGIRLWSIYAGAYLEQAAVASASSNEDASRDWFNARLADQASAMGLVAWPQVRESLLGFIYIDVLKPNGATWFIKTMEANGR